MTFPLSSLSHQLMADSDKSPQLLLVLYKSEENSYHLGNIQLPPIDKK